MRNKLDKRIKESIESLRQYKKNAPNYRIKTRIESLILIKSNEFTRLQDIANHLSIGLRSLKRWLKIYEEKGLEHLLGISNGGRRYCNISLELHEALKEKTHNSEDPFMSYVEAVQWVKENYGQTVKYTTLRSYLVDNFKTKVKRPRKSHYKKDEQAIEAFKKTSQPV